MNPAPSLLDQLHRLLERTYRMRSGLDAVAPFVIGDRADYDWAKGVIERHSLLSRCPVLVTPVCGALPPVDLANWVLEDRLGVRVSLQLHKLIWPPTSRGV